MTLLWLWLPLALAPLADPSVAFEPVASVQKDAGEQAARRAAAAKSGGAAQNPRDKAAAAKAAAARGAGQQRAGQKAGPGKPAAAGDSESVKVMAAVRRILDEERGHDERLKEILGLRRESLRRGQDHRVESLEIFLERELRRHEEFLAQGRKELGDELFAKATEEAQRVLDADKAELLARIQAASRARPASAPRGAANPKGGAAGRAKGGRPPGGAQQGRKKPGNAKP